MAELTYAARTRFMALGEEHLPGRLVDTSGWPPGLAKKLEDTRRIYRVADHPHRPLRDDKRPRAR